jgi:chromate transporter
MIVWRIFWLFSRVALFSWGGGPASLALMQREVTMATWVPPGALGPEPWVTSAEFADAVAIGNALPGPIAPQVSSFVGYKLAGISGAIAAAAGTVLPTTLLMLILVVFFFGIKDNLTVKAMLRAVRPVIVGLLLWTTYEMAVTVLNVKKLGWSSALVHNWDGLLIVAGAFAVLTLTRVNPALVVAGAAVLGFLLYR